MSETCSERERLISKWSESSSRVARLEGERLAAIKKSDPSVADFNEQIRQAKTEEIEACRAYYFHARQHDYV